MQTITFPPIEFRFSVAALLLLLVGHTSSADDDSWTDLGADNHFAAWHQPTGDWYEAGDATLDPNDNRRLVGKPGTGVLINGSRTKSLVTKQTFEDVEVHLEFMVAGGANSGVSFHGNYEIQILDSYGIKEPTGGDCGGIYPRCLALYTLPAPPVWLGASARAVGHAVKLGSYLVLGFPGFFGR